MSATTTKVTSPGSQYSTSAAPSVPYPTPAAEALDSAVVDPPPPMDFAAVAQLLGPMQETLNESAVEAMIPSPPINTPEALSPNPSLYRYPLPRGRGFSVYGDRLAQLKLDDRKFAPRDTDNASTNRSVEPSVIGDDEGEAASISEVLSDGGKDRRGPVVGSSPRANDRIEEFLSFSSKDLPTKSPALCFASMIDSTSTKTAVEPASSRDSTKSDGGVTEKSNWAEEVEDAVVHTCLRMEQLAQDEHAANPVKSFNDYYLDRLKRLLGDSKRILPVKVQEVSKPASEHAKGS
ncbi:hypothetical protein ACN47E_010325 [Coniothyrium glycines]